MKKGVIQISLVAVATLFLFGAAYALDQPEQSTGNEGTENEVTGDDPDIEKTQESVNNTSTHQFFNDYIKGHLQIGVRSTLRVLTDDDSGHRGGTYGSGTYLGTIYALDAEQNAAPILGNITYYFNNYIGLELAYDRIEAETVAFDSSTLQDKNDGNVIISGPTISLLTRYKNSTNFTPYAGIGLGFYSSTFDADPDWTLSPEYDGAAYNLMDVDNAIGLQFTAGTKWLFSENWALDLSLQYVQADVDAIYTGYYNDVLYTVQTGHFPLDNVAFRLGVTYNF